MSMYKILDAAIMNKIGGHPQKFFEIYVRDVRAECNRLSSETGTESTRFLDRRLQALRKKGLIQFTGKGWMRAEINA